MIGLMAGAPDRAPTFHYHVDPSAGNDSTGTGTKALPYATVTKALTVATAGQSIGLKAGTVLRDAANLAPAVKLRFGKYGTGADPIMSGGRLVTSWTNVGFGSEILTNPGFEVSLTGWTVEVGNCTRDTGLFHSGASSLKIAVASDSDKISQAVSVTSGTRYTISFWYQGDTSGKNMSFQFTDGTNWLQPNGTISTAAVSIVPPQSLNSWAQYTITFTATNTTTWTYRLQGYDGGTYNYHVDDASFKAASGTAGTYTAALTSSPAYVGSNNAGVTTGLSLGASATTLATNQFYWASNVLSVNLGGTNPGTVAVEAAVNGIMAISNAHGADGSVWRGIEFRYGYDRGVHIAQTTYFTFDRCTLRYFGYVANSGSLSIDHCGAGAFRVARCVFDNLMNDAVWWNGTAGAQIDHNTVTNIGVQTGDVQSDGLQMDTTDYDSSGRLCGGAWLHHNYVNSTGTTSPKAGINLTASSPTVLSPVAIVEYNTCIGNAVGLASAAVSGAIFRYNTASGNAGSSLAILGTVDNVQMYRNLAYTTHSGFTAYPSSVITNLVHDNNTYVDCSIIGIDFNGVSVSGTNKNNLVYGQTVTPLFLTRYNMSGSGWSGTSDYNLYGPNSANVFENGVTNYSTLAAFATAVSRESHSIASNPSFAEYITYTLSLGSPAIDAGTIISGITDGYLGAAPDLGYAEKA